MGISAWNGCYASSPGPNSAFHLSDVRGLLFLRDEPRTPLKNLIAGVAEPVIFGGPETLLSHECSWLRVPVRMSSVCHKTSEAGLFACQNLGAKDAVGLCYGSQTLPDSRKKSRVTKRYGNEYMEKKAEPVCR